MTRPILTFKNAICCFFGVQRFLGGTLPGEYLKIYFGKAFIAEMLILVQSSELLAELEVGH